MFQQQLSLQQAHYLKQNDPSKVKAILHGFQLLPVDDETVQKSKGVQQQDPNFGKSAHTASRNSVFISIPLTSNNYVRTEFISSHIVPYYEIPSVRSVAVIDDFTVRVNVPAEHVKEMEKRGLTEHLSISKVPSSFSFALPYFHVDLNDLPPQERGEFEALGSGSSGRVLVLNKTLLGILTGCCHVGQHRLLIFVNTSVVDFCVRNLMIGLKEGRDAGSIWYALNYDNVELWTDYAQVFAQKVRDHTQNKLQAGTWFNKTVGYKEIWQPCMKDMTWEDYNFVRINGSNIFQDKSIGKGDSFSPGHVGTTQKWLFKECEFGKKKNSNRQKFWDWAIHPNVKGAKVISELRKVMDDELVSNSDFDNLELKKLRNDLLDRVFWGPAFVKVSEAESQAEGEAEEEEEAETEDASLKFRRILTFSNVVGPNKTPFLFHRHSNTTTDQTHTEMLAMKWILEEIGDLRVKEKTPPSKWKKWNMMLLIKMDGETKSTETHQTLKNPCVPCCKEFEKFANALKLLDVTFTNQNNWYC